MCRLRWTQLVIPLCSFWQFSLKRAAREIQISILSDFSGKSVTMRTQPHLISMARHSQTLYRARKTNTELSMAHWQHHPAAQSRNGLFSRTRYPYPAVNCFFLAIFITSDIIWWSKTGATSKIWMIARYLSIDQAKILMGSRNSWACGITFQVHIFNQNPNSIKRYLSTPRMDWIISWVCGITFQVQIFNKNPNLIKRYLSTPRTD